MSLDADLAVQAAALVAGVRSAVALADARVRAGDWPLWRCGPAVGGILLHDVALGLAGYALFVVPTYGLGAVGVRPIVRILAATVLALLLTGRIVRRRRGLPLTAIGRPGALAQEPVLTLRDRLMIRIERTAVRASSRWIARELADCRRRSCANDEQLLPAVWAPARIRLRETVGVGRTEVALLLLQAQSVVDDASPPQERLLTLLHLVHERAGRGGIRSVLGRAARGPLRHGRAGIPAPLSVTSNPFPTPTRDHANLS